MSGPLNHSPAEIIQQAIVDDNLGNQPSLSGNWPTYVNNNQKSNTSNLTVLDTTGIIRGKTHVDSEPQEQFGIQLLVRHPAPNISFSKANELFSTLSSWHRKLVSVEDSLYIIHAATFSSPVIRVGKEQPEEVLFIYSLNLLSSIRLLE
jgi:hypothetical protein